MSVSENLQHVRETIEASAAVAGRDPGGVELLVVSKTWPAEILLPLIKEGQWVYGENRVQEAIEKAPRLPAGVQWHLIGHLQKNKARKALGLFQAIHSVDSLPLARQLDRVAAEMGRSVEIYLQVNAAGEEQKHGFSPAEVEEAMPALIELSHLRIRGLMAIPPYAAAPEATRPHFRALGRCRDGLEARFGVSLPGLSMGMSHDYPVAIEEGATIVRVGSAIFGERHASSEGE